MDGFRFDLASALCRDPLGNPMAVPPLIEQCAKDPVLSKARCICLAGPCMLLPHLYGRLRACVARLQPRAACAHGLPICIKCVWLRR